MAGSGKRKILFEPGGEKVRVDGGSMVYDAAKKAGVKLDDSCNGKGKCGKCLFFVESGKVKAGDTDKLKAGKRKKGWILACMTKPRSDLVLLSGKAAEKAAKKSGRKSKK